MSSELERDATTQPPAPSDEQSENKGMAGRHRYSLHGKRQWKAAVRMARGLQDPWVELGFEDIEEESVIRHMYNPRTRNWKNDRIIVKIQPKVFAIISDWIIFNVLFFLQPFAHGAMRECFRM